jgi:endoglucanase
LGKHYTWPEKSSIDWFVQRGFNTFRIGFLMERLSPPATGLTGGFDSTYLNSLKEIVNYTTSKGAYAVVNPHNFMRYNGAVISDTVAFKAWWTKLASEFKDNQRVIFDVNNEPNNMSVDLTFDLQQAGVDGIRASGAHSQLILISGTAWTGAWTWISSGNSARIGDVKDPYNNLAIQMHQYLDTDGSGTSPTCVSPTIGAERVKEATAWCKAKGVKCFLGEIGAGSNDQCIAAVKSALCAMQQGGGAWVGALWWAAGPWWGDYYQSIEPPSGPAIQRILPEALMPFM